MKICPSQHACCLSTDNKDIHDFFKRKVPRGRGFKGTEKRLRIYFLNPIYFIYDSFSIFFSLEPLEP